MTGLMSYGSVDLGTDSGAARNTTTAVPEQDGSPSQHDRAGQRRSSA